MSLVPRKLANMEGRGGSEQSLCAEIGKWEGEGLRTRKENIIQDIRIFKLKYR